jgi:hypothetical protein
VQEALAKIDALADLRAASAVAPDRPAAEQQDARGGRGLRLGAQRGPAEDRAAAVRAAPGAPPPLQVCLQVNISGEASKSGVAPAEVPALARGGGALPADARAAARADGDPRAGRRRAPRSAPHRALLRELLRGAARAAWRWTRCRWA